MLPKLDVPKSPRSFEDADGLVTYLEWRLRTPQAFVSMEHLAQLAYLADSEIHLSEKDIEKLSRRSGLVSLKENNYASLVPVARLRVKKGEIPNNWLDEFTKSINDYGDK